MFNEIYNGIVTITSGIVNDSHDVDDMEYMSDVDMLPHMMNILYNIDPTTVTRKLVLENLSTPKNIEPIMFFISGVPNENPRTTYSTYIMYRGRVYYAIMLNSDALTCGDVYLRRHAIAHTIFTACRHYTNYYTNRFNNVSEYQTELIYSILLYAPAIITVKTLQRIWHQITKEEIAAILSTFYKEEVTALNIEAIMDLLTQFSLLDLLDNSYFYMSRTTNPDAWFVDLNKLDEKLEKSDEK